MKLLRGTIFGGIAHFFVGWFIYGVLLMKFMAAHMNQCAARPDEQMVWWAMILASLLVAFLLTLILKWSQSKSWLDGLIKGAIFGFLIAAMMDFSTWSMTTMYATLLPLIADIVAATILYGIVGMLIVLLWGKE